MNENILRKYARLAVCSGANVQPGQLLVISSSVKDYQFTKLCVEEAYKVGAGAVSVEWDYEDITKMRFQYCSIETLTEVPQWSFDKRKWAQDKGCCFLHIESDTPGFMADVDQNKIREARMAAMKVMYPLREYTMANHGQWCIVALPSVGWAKKVFPEMNDEDAVNALWDAILKSVRISEDNDPVAEWKQHDEDLAKHCQLLNELHFDKLHFTNSKGTDLYVGLVKKHCWAGGSCFSTKGVEFNPNMPTEEVFCMPDKNNVEGVVYASKPLDYSGKVIENFWFRFEKGAVVEYGAEKSEDALKNLLDTDEGSKHLGEVALISYHSPISLMNILFYNTLFDENASCHLALGEAYPENIVGGTEMSPEQLAAEGANNSHNHVDFMFGTEDMKVVGIKEDGSEVVVFENGDFII